MHEPFGLIRLPARPAADPWHARSPLTMYAVEPRSTATVRLNASGLRRGEVAGLLLADAPRAWLGVERLDAGLTLAQFDEDTGRTIRVALADSCVWLRAECDFGAGEASFSFSTDGIRYDGIGGRRPAGGRPDGARGISCTLFCRAAGSRSRGGFADFDSFLLATDRVRYEREAHPVAWRRQLAARPVESRRTSSGSMTNSCSSRVLPRFIRHSQMVRPI